MARTQAEMNVVTGVSRGSYASSAFPEGHVHARLGIHIQLAKTHVEHEKLLVIFTKTRREVFWLDITDDNPASMDLFYGRDLRRKAAQSNQDSEDEVDNPPSVPQA